MNVTLTMWEYSGWLSQWSAVPFTLWISLLCCIYASTFWRFRSFYLGQSSCLPVRAQSFPLDSSKPSFMLSCGSLLITLQIWPRDDLALKWLIVSMEGVCGPPYIHSLLLLGLIPFSSFWRNFSSLLGNSSQHLFPLRCREDSWMVCF